MEIRYFDIPWPNDIQPHDYFAHLESGNAVIKAHELIENPEAEIIAWLINPRRKEIYLYGKDDKLYYHMYNDEILNQYIPYQEFQRYINSQSVPGLPGTETEPQPKGWRYWPHYPSNTLTLLHESIYEGYKDSWESYKTTLFISSSIRFNAGEEFPIFIHNALKRTLNKQHTL